MTRQEVIAKARDLIAPVLGTETFNKLSRKVFEIEKVSDVREFQPLLRCSLSYRFGSYNRRGKITGSGGCRRTAFGQWVSRAAN